MKVADASGDSEPMDTSYIQGHRFREFHEVLFSVNIALAVIMGLQFRPYDVFLPLFRLEEFFSHQLGPKRSVAPAYLAFFLLVAILTVVTLLLLRCLRRTIVEYILVFVAGFTALGLTAACWFYIMSPYGSHWYPAEVGIYFALATLYVLQKWTSTSSAIILIAGFHYGFWFLRFWEYGEERFQLLVPIIGLFAGIAWVIYVPIGRARLFPTSPSG